VIIKFYFWACSLSWDLIVYILSPKGQAEITNYRTVKIPTNANIPIFIKDEFSNFYKSMFQTSYTKEDQKVAFLEYAWDMGNCDPCSADPLNREEMQQAGLFWLDDNSASMPDALLTNWQIQDIRQKMKLSVGNLTNSWWQIF
jgi:hypothetical protein